MAQEKFTQEAGIDDLTALTTLLRTVRGISVISTPPLVEVPAESEDDFDA